MARDVVVELARGEDEPRHARAIDVRVVEDGLEAAVHEIGKRRGSLLEPQQALRRHHDERPRVRVERLAAQEMEVLRRRGRVDDADVLLGGELEEPLEARARVLRAVALVAVREEERQARGLAPLGEPRDEELVDDDLRAVDEVAELRLPEDERLRRRHRVAVLEAERGVLRERRVVGLEGCGRLRQVLDRSVLGARVRVVEDEVAVGEGAALGVLAGEADRDALDEQARERERLGLAPVDAAGVERLDPPLEHLHELRVDGEALRHVDELGRELSEPVFRDAGGDVCFRRGWGAFAVCRLGRRKWSLQSLVRGAHLGAPSP